MGIKKEFTLSEEQYVSIFRDILALVGSTPEKPKKPMGPFRQRLKIIIGVFIVLAWLALSGDNVSVGSVIIYCMVFIPYLAFMYFFPPYCHKSMARKVYQTSAALKNLQYIEVSSDGVVSGGAGHKTTLEWSQIYMIDKGKHNYLIFLGYCTAIGIPLDLLSDQEQMVLEGYKSQTTPAPSIENSEALA